MDPNAYAAAWRKANPDKVRANNRITRATRILPLPAFHCSTCGKLTTRNSNFQHRCADCRRKVRAEDQRRRRLRKGYRQHLPELLMRQGFACALCGELICSEDIRTIATVDHIVPQAKGGGNERSNLQAVHLHCNSRKAHH